MRRRHVLGLIGGSAVLGVAGCSVTENGMLVGNQPRPEGSVNTDNPAADSLATVTREQVDAAVRDLPESVATAMEQVGTPGIAVAVIYQGETIYTHGFGVRNMDTQEPVDPSTVFPLASVSKSLSATVVARAIGQGTVTWDTPVAQHLTGFTLSDPWVGEHVTIGDMFAHRSGLYDHAGDDLEELGYDRATILERLKVIPLAPFRSTYAYTNFGVTAAAESLARARGIDWADLARQELFEPLGMAETSARFADLETRTNRAVGHVEVDGVWRVSNPQRQPDAQAPAGGDSSSVNDLAIWVTMLLASGKVKGEAFIAAKDLVPAISPKIVVAQNAASGNRVGTYGYGFNVTTTAGGYVDVNHSGAFTEGAATVVKMLPEAGLGIVLLTNGAPTGVPEGIAGRFMDLAQYGERRQDWLAEFLKVFAALDTPSGELVGKTPPTNPAPAKALSTYVGSYANAYFGPATVSQSGDALELAVGPTGRWPMEHWDGDVFIFRPMSENAVPGTISQVTFSGDQVVIEYFDPHGLGTFTRA